MAEDNGYEYEFVGVDDDLCPTCRKRRRPIVEGICARALAIIQPAIERLVVEHLEYRPDRIEYEAVRVLVEEQVYLACHRAAGINRLTSALMHDD